MLREYRRIKKDGFIRFNFFILEVENKKLVIIRFLMKEV